MREICKWENNQRYHCIDWLWYRSNSLGEISSGKYISYTILFCIRYRYSDLCSCLQIGIMDTNRRKTPFEGYKLYRIWYYSLWKSIYRSSRDRYCTPSMRKWYTYLDTIGWTSLSDECSQCWPSKRIYRAIKEPNRS